MRVVSHDSEPPAVMVSAGEIAQRVAAMAVELDAVFAARATQRPVVVLPVLTGALIFAADLVRQMQTAVTIEPLSARSYRGESVRAGELEIRLGPSDLAGCDVLIVDDIYDSGATLAALSGACVQAGAASVQTAVLLKKDRPDLPDRPRSCDFWAVEIPDAFVVGYGLDYDGHYRNLPYIGVL